VRISTGFNIFEHLWFQGNGTTPYDLDIHTIRCYLTQETRIYGLGVGISIFFEILGHFLFKREWDYHVRSWLTYHQMLLDTRNKNTYGLGVRISTVFQIFGHFLFKENGTTSYGHDLHVIWCSKEQEYILFRVGEFNCFKDIKKFPLLCLYPTPCDNDLCLYYVWKVLCKFELFGPIGSW
jgi:hypothetical protein